MFLHGKVINYYEVVAYGGATALIAETTESVTKQTLAFTCNSQTW